MVGGNAGLKTWGSFAVAGTWDSKFTQNGLYSAGEWRVVGGETVPLGFILKMGIPWRAGLKGENSGA